MINHSKRPLAHLSAIAKAYPTAWKDIERLRTLRGDDLPDWPNWCYLPIAGGIAITTKHGIPTDPEAEIRAGADAYTLAALGAWRQTKGIYAFHPELLESLWGTPITGDLPTQVLKRLPEWCVYLPLERQLDERQTLHGAWAHLEWDYNTKREELRLLLDINDKLLPIPIHLGSTLKEGIDQAVNEALTRRQLLLNAEDFNTATGIYVDLAAPIINLLLYLASDQPEITGKGRPGNPRPTKTKAGLRTFPAPGPRQWQVGARIGAALHQTRTASEAEAETDRAAGRARPRPHIRRAHWKLYWTGPKTAPQTPILHWIPPTLVAADPRNTEALPATIRPVNTKPHP